VTTGPGDTDVNELEAAVLGRLADADPSIHSMLRGLHVLSRVFTGVGSFTHFRREAGAEGGARRTVGLDAVIRIPSVASGLGALLFCRGAQPLLLELYTFGHERWDGTYDGFRIEDPS
jgi:hypothetical protein